jgi:hypothetical protein
VSATVQNSGLLETLLCLLGIRLLDLKIARSQRIEIFERCLSMDGPGFVESTVKLAGFDEENGWINEDRLRMY